VFAGHNDISEITKNIDEDDIEENKNVNPIIPHLKRWFVKKENAELMWWHAQGCKKDGMLHRHANGIQWRNFDVKNQDFKGEVRNIRLR
jgi:hypothetical protein